MVSKPILKAFLTIFEPELTITKLMATVVVVVVVVVGGGGGGGGGVGVVNLSTTVTRTSRSAGKRTCFVFDKSPVLISPERRPLKETRKLRPLTSLLTHYSSHLVTAL
jgi:hypothetical protein